ncbi:FAD/NAD(P)-binding domain-containing protein [Coniochaeta ligniaria NRRL 30616]|uniref:FAD/NAD(P)-binding domain-containing protein n=1 Tax=Coniochaeta ligniaria NRRL 30616 TaxID=1408157 RepID=A0A1J7ITE3_9PEZI|nr:FAD/NAD(P)-binding domain-containing protein [Coniochaeta ligniaria NRRL 30616]
MSSPEYFDCVIIGSGEAGKYTAWTLGSKYGKKCAIIERKYLGGACPNIACLPSKNFIHSASVAYNFRQAASYGLGSFVAKADDVKVDMTVPGHRKVAMVDGLMDLHVGNFRKANTEVILGEGKFIGPKTIAVAGRMLTGDAIIVNTGTRALVDSTIPGLVESKPLTHVEILDLEVLPSHLIILGGGYVGLEFAQAYRRFGSQVTVIEKHERVLGKEDEDIVEALVGIITGEGVRIITSAKIDKVSGASGDSVQVSVNVAGSISKITGSHILVATGRVPNTENMGLEEAGINLTRSKHVLVDEQLRTTADGVFAVGDCAGSPYFTHISFDDFRVVLSNLTGCPRPGGTTDRQVPSVLFTSHELAHVGLREHEAQDRGIKYRLGKMPMAAFLRTRTLGDSRGFAKVLVEAEGDKILGFTALGLAAGELLPVVQLAMKLGISYKEVSNLVIVHPTMGEGLVGLFNSV